jgi:trehalose 6-phosphate phosphatase
MSGALGTALRQQLLSWARRDALLAFDFDGVLAPLVPDPAAAEVPATTRARLARLAQRRRCAVLSGRALADLAPRLAGLPLVARVGNHGSEVEHMAPPTGLRERVGAWAAELTARLAGQPGVAIEDKGLSLSLHYRHAPEPARAAAAALAAASGLPGARIFGGHSVVNVVSEEAPDKGDALRALLAATGAEAALYVGDDLTDECAFALADELPLLGVRVGPVIATRAAHVLRSRAEVDELLDALLEGVAAAA